MGSIELLDAGLYTTINKYQFHDYKVEFVGFTIGSSGISMSTNKVEQILDW